MIKFNGLRRILSIVLFGLLLLTMQQQSVIAQPAKSVQLSGTINLDTLYTFSVLPLVPELSAEISEETSYIDAQGNFSWNSEVSTPQWVTIVFGRKAKDYQLGASFPLLINPGDKIRLNLSYSDSTYLGFKSGKVDRGNKALIAYAQFVNQQARRNFTDPAAADQFVDRASAYLLEAERLIKKHKVRTEVVMDYMRYWSYNDYLNQLFGSRVYRPVFEDLTPSLFTNSIDDARMLWFYMGYQNLNRYLDTYIASKTQLPNSRSSDPAERLKQLSSKIEYAKQLFSTNKIVDLIVRRNIETFISSYPLRSQEEFLEHKAKLSELLLNLSEESARAAVLKTFENLLYTQVGSIAPDVEFLDLSGRPVKLQDFAGNYMYIDLWASWCVPCIREIPYLHQLEKDYAGKNIVFLSISLDADKKAWRNKVDELKLEGHQWELGNSKFDQLLNVRGIPHFLLYGPDGKLMQYQAPRPSSTQIRDLFDSLK